MIKLDDFIKNDKKESDYLRIKKENLISLREYITLLGKKKLEFDKETLEIKKYFNYVFPEIQKVIYNANELGGVIIICYENHPYLELIFDKETEKFKVLDYTVTGLSKTVDSIYEKRAEKRSRMIINFQEVLKDLSAIGKDIYKDVKFYNYSVSDLFYLLYECDNELKVLSYKNGKPIIWKYDVKKGDCINKLPFGVSSSKTGNQLLDKIELGKRESEFVKVRKL